MLDGFSISFGFNHHLLNLQIISSHLIISEIFWFLLTSFKCKNQISWITFIFYIRKFESPFFNKSIKYFFLFFISHTTSVNIKIIFSNFVSFNYLFTIFFYCTDLVLSLIFNCFCLLFKSFTKRIISKLSLFYYLKVIFIRRKYFFTCKIFILINFA